MGESSQRDGHYLGPSYMFGYLHSSLWEQVFLESREENATTASTWSPPQNRPLYSWGKRKLKGSFIHIFSLKPYWWTPVKCCGIFQEAKMVPVKDKTVLVYRCRKKKNGELPTSEADLSSLLPPLSPEPEQPLTDVSEFYFYHVQC